jgi:hypothetical protein
MPKQTDKLNADGEQWFTVRVDTQMLQKLKQLAEQQERSVSHQIRFMLKEALSKIK